MNVCADRSMYEGLLSTHQVHSVSELLICLPPVHLLHNGSQHGDGGADCSHSNSTNVANSADVANRVTVFPWGATEGCVVGRGAFISCNRRMNAVQSSSNVLAPRPHINELDIEFSYFLKVPRKLFLRDFPNRVPN